MCGIFGFVVNKESGLDYSVIESVTQELFRLSETRGKDSSGIAICNSNKKEISVLKDSISGSSFIKTKQFKKFYHDSLYNLFNEKSRLAHPLALIGHCRMVTNGTRRQEYNNQPVIKNNCVAVHNGIIVNEKEIWEQNVDIIREYDVDTEVILELINKFQKESDSLAYSISQTFKTIYGEASIAVLFKDINKMALASNTGSIYITNKYGVLVFASERFIVQKFLEKFNKELPISKIVKVEPQMAVLVDLESVTLDFVNMNSGNFDKIGKRKDESFNIKNYSKATVNRDRTEKSAPEYRDLLEYNIEDIKKLKRCTKCLLPETFPFIEYDERGECNYCRNYERQETLGEEKLKKLIKAENLDDKNTNCILTFSGGRDSCFGLHYLKKELNINPLAYTYDWGMVTDLGRRNQSRMCSKLGVEHIIVSADIAKKRANIRKNVSAWLKRPKLGTVPLFMAGDKQYFYYANKLGKQNNAKVVFLCDNPLEVTNFKYGFCGVQPKFSKKGQLFSLSKLSKLRMILFYFKEYLLNPSYINSSIIDTISAFFSYYSIPHDYLNLYRFIEWNEGKVEKALIEEYDWELSEDTKSTWRIGDGTAAFYNYIYCTVAGFTENDTFRSNQIREGMLQREEALKMIEIDNKPRYESIKWYLEIIGLDFKETIETINRIPKLYK